MTPSIGFVPFAATRRAYSLSPSGSRFSSARAPRSTTRTSSRCGASKPAATGCVGSMGLKCCCTSTLPLFSRVTTMTVMRRGSRDSGKVVGTKPGISTRTRIEAPFSADAPWSACASTIGASANGASASGSSGPVSPRWRATLHCARNAGSPIASPISTCTAVPFFFSCRSGSIPSWRRRLNPYFFGQRAAQAAKARIELSFAFATLPRFSEGST